MTKSAQIVVTAFQANVTGTASNPTTLKLPNGNVLVSYVTELGGLPGTEDGFHIRGQMYNPNGEVVGREIAFSFPDPIVSRDFDIIVRPDGTIAIAALGAALRDRKSPVMVRSFSIDDEGNRETVSNIPSLKGFFEDNTSPTIANIGGDGLIILSVSQKPLNDSIFYRILGVDGAPDINDSFGRISGADTVLASATLGNGNVVTVVDLDGNGDTFDEVFFNILTSNGIFSGSGEALGGRGSILDPQVVALASGGFVIAGTKTAGDPDVVFQVFDVQGVPVTGTVEFGIDEIPLRGNNNEPTIAALEDGGFIVFYDKDRGSPQIRGQRFDSEGRPVGNDFLVANENGGQLSAASLDDGRIAISYAVTSGSIKTAIVTVNENVVRGTGDSEVLNGTEARDFIQSEGGNDTIAAGNGEDRVVAGTGRR